MSGAYPDLSVSLAQGYRLAVAVLNEQGGIDGRPVKLILCDDQSFPSQSVTLYRRLLDEDKVDFLLGRYSSEITAATVSIFEDDETPVIASVASNESIWEGQDRKWTVPLLAPGAVYLQGSVEAEAGAKSIALAYEDNPFPLTAAGGVRSKAEELGMDILMDVEYPSTGADYLALANMAKEPNADVFIGGGFIPGYIALTKAADEASYSPMLQSWLLGVDSTDFIEQVGGLAECVAGNNWWLPSLAFEGRLGTNQGFVEMYDNYWLQPANNLTAAGFAAVELMVEAIEHSLSTEGDLDRSTIAEYLFATDTETINGPYAVLPDGENAGIQTTLQPLQIQWQPDSSGELVEKMIFPPEHATAQICFN